MVELERPVNRGRWTENGVTLVSLLSIAPLLFEIYFFGSSLLLINFSDGSSWFDGSIFETVFFYTLLLIPPVIATTTNRFLSKRFPLLTLVKKLSKASLVALVISLVIGLATLPAAVKGRSEYIAAEKLKTLIKEKDRVQDEQRATTLAEEVKVKSFAIEALSYLADRNTEKFISVLSQDTINETESSELKDVVANQWMPYFSNLGREKISELINNNTAITLGFAGTYGNITQLEIGVSGGTQDSTLTVVHFEKEAERYTVRMILLTSSDDSDDPAMVDRYFRNLQ